MLSYIYRFFRPKNVEDAAKKKMYLSMVYGFLSWNCFMYMFYTIVISQLPTDPEEQRNALMRKLAHGQNIKHIRIEGLTLVEDDLIDQETPKVEKED
uniref:uncharacterized protein LOC117602656 n=1 Tax=Osmia lignaria TaxID=473952 RepID=UPI0014796C24|nr:uncharacterized protein LOC117602656 [Osmia lignaria]